ncbi:uncharacterized protein TRIVIDRAFT_216651 [Trichoderma virens Gv29-8]|uniref:Uncharacterized protein n=1 Tax=Hypocrea virens (strain Gv29-8 / FGSC 10586) TaxID=413071 RepID=G9N3K4_HYPVG|nr:uncharacterized protein TRIVIDRAFT_216651 [Trichoderma virens Gv29-8]EHK18888.1 hypothetical protein TRIVIDRAFT_216651 [Trichoderma virens Gv29-8]
MTKNSGVLLLQQLARDTPASKMQIVSFHPGAILSPGAKHAGLNEQSLNWDDSAYSPCSLTQVFSSYGLPCRVVNTNHPCHLVSLPSSVAIWAASDEAAFLHGRFIWSAWDVEELQSGPLRERIEKDEQFLRIGVHGV